jgi:molecular chaperone GrpE
LSEKEKRDVVEVEEDASAITVTEDEMDGQEGADFADDKPDVELDDKAHAIKEKLEEAEAKAAEYLDGWQRSRAEFANARKRLERERANAYRNASVDYVAKMLPILDDFDRALATVPTEIAEDSWFEGLRLVRRKLSTLMDDLSVEPIDAVGLPFDPNMHEALALVEGNGQESGIVVEEVQTGYRIGDKVIRPALVNVAA